MKIQKCRDCKFYTPFLKITHFRLGKPIHGVCTKHNESVSFVEACEEFEIEEKEKEKLSETENN